MPRLLAALLIAALVPTAGEAQLELPDRPRTPAPRPTAGTGTRSRPEVAPRPDAPAEPTPSESLAERVRRLEELREVSDPLGIELARELLALPQGGRAALLGLLDGDRPAAIVAAARALLADGRPESFAIVAARLRERLPARAVGPLLAAVRTADPVRGGPALLVALLDHPQSVMRNAARDALGDRIGPELLPHLVAVLASRRSETRRDALGIAAEIEDPSVMHLFVDRLGDASSNVASEAARLLAASPDARVVETLRGLALGRALGHEEQRRAAYALLALTQREVDGDVALLGDEDVPRLLELLRGVHPARKGAAAIALADVGFRSERPEHTSWLDLEVPHELVKIASGAEFHSDFSSLQGPATRRLARLSGHSFGTDGPAWQEWWTRGAGTFEARRAVLRAAPEDAAGLRVLVRDPDAEPSAFELLGPDAEPSGGAAVFHLTEPEARDLLGVARREGLLSAERLPGHRGPRDAPERALAIGVAGQTKEIAFHGPLGDEPWFGRVLDFAHALADRNRWQRYADPERRASQRSVWLEERDWWAAQRPDAERARRLVERILGAWASAGEELRAEALADLEDLYADPAVPAPSHFDRLVAALAEPPELARDDAARLVELAIAAASAPRAEAAEAAEPGAPTGAAALSVVRGQELLQALLDVYGPRAEELTRRVLTAAPAEVAHAASADPRGYLRAAVAPVLVDLDDETSRERFRALFDDPLPGVQAAAASAAGDAGSELWRAVLLERAADEEPEVRASALRAAGHLGGDDARGALVSGLASSHPAVRVAAADGLAQLADPTTVSLLVSLLAEGPDSPLFAPARRGLLRLGSVAWPDLLRTTHAGRGRVRREAAYLLAEQGVAEVASTLLRWLTEDPDDARLAQELAVLTCIDMRRSSDPPAAWWEWWDIVVHDDSIAWLKAALERAEVEAPPVAELRPPMTERGARALLDAVERGDGVLAERARRELARLVGLDAVAPPAADRDRAAWIADLRATVLRTLAAREARRRGESG